MFTPSYNNTNYANHEIVVHDEDDRRDEDLIYWNWMAITDPTKFATITNAMIRFGTEDNTPVESLQQQLPNTHAQLWYFLNRCDYCGSVYSQHLLKVKPSVVVYCECEKVFYCSKEHQNKAQKHKLICNYIKLNLL